MNAAINQPSILTLRLGQSDQAGQGQWDWCDVQATDSDGLRLTLYTYASKDRRELLKFSIARNVIGQRPNLTYDKNRTSISVSKGPQKFKKVCDGYTIAERR